MVISAVENSERRVKRIEIVVVWKQGVATRDYHTSMQVVRDA